MAKSISEFEVFHEGTIADQKKILSDPSQYSFLNKFEATITNTEGSVVATAEDIKNKDQFGSFVASGYFKYSDGDMLNTGIGRHKIYLNFCNDAGKWDSGNISKVVGERWKNTETEYKRWYHSQYVFKLGELQEIIVQSDAMVINCLVFNSDEVISEEACKVALNKLATLAKLYNSIVYTKCTYDWNVVERQIIDIVVRSGITVVVFEENI